MALALGMDDLKSALLAQNLNDRNVRYLLKYTKISQKKYRNGQLLYLYKHWAEIFETELTETLLASIFDIPLSDVSRIIRKDEEIPNDPGRDPALMKNKILMW